MREENLNKTILIAEDEPALLRVLSDSFQDAGFKVLEAEDGQKALDLALSSHPDCLLLDILMPKMDGLTVIEKLRQDEWGKTAYIVVLTNFSDSQKVAKATENYVFDYLVKQDWKIEDIVKEIKTKLNIK
ncbi:MAG: response regulator [bacterium]